MLFINKLWTNLKQKALPDFLLASGLFGFLLLLEWRSEFMAVHTGMTVESAFGSHINALLDAILSKQLLYILTAYIFFLFGICLLPWTILRLSWVRKQVFSTISVAFAPIATLAWMLYALFVWLQVHLWALTSGKIDALQFALSTCSMVLIPLSATSLQAAIEALTTTEDRKQKTEKTWMMMLTAIVLMMAPILLLPHFL